MTATQQRDPAGPAVEQQAPEVPDRGGALGRAIRGSHGEGSFAARYALLGVWLVLAAFYAVFAEGFLSTGTFLAIFGSQQAYVFLGMAAVITLSVDEFDLSIASNMGLGAILTAVLVVQNDWAPAAAVAVALAACAGVGVLNGLIVVRLGISAIVTTLGMGTLVLGITERLSNGSTVAGLSTSLSEYANKTFLLDLPVSFYYGLALALLLAYVMRYTPLGRHMAFVGANREVARLAGVRVARIRIGAYVAAGFLSGLGGVLLSVGNGGFDPSSAAIYLLPAFAATFLGTSTIRPGRFNALGTMAAIYFLVTGITGLQLLGYTGWVSNVFYGSALIVAVVISTAARRRALQAR